MDKKLYKNKSEEIIYKTLLSSDYYNKLPLTNEKIALETSDTYDYYSICVNFMGTGLHIKKTDIDEFELEEVGIKVWRTWHYNG